MFWNGASVSHGPQSSTAGLWLRSACTWIWAQSWQSPGPPLTASPPTISTIWKNDSFRSLALRGMTAKLIGFDWRACRVRRCVVSPAANEALSKCAPICSEFGGENALWPSAGVV